MNRPEGLRIYYEHIWSRNLRARLDQDPTWPPWIPVKEGTEGRKDEGTEGSEGAGDVPGPQTRPAARLELRPADFICGSKFTASIVIGEFSVAAAILHCARGWPEIDPKSLDRMQRASAV